MPRSYPPAITGDWCVEWHKDQETWVPVFDDLTTQLEELIVFYRNLYSKIPKAVGGVPFRFRNVRTGEIIPVELIM